ncbi:50S ribosomal protein L15e [Candidatus Norongarragalina meridionalis]|nr:50S ribosomal protein L15e [Candidatus Norongarragalina meridionalis]
MTSATKYIRGSFRKSYKKRDIALKQWRGEHTIERAEKPANPVRARTLGWKATKDYIIARVRVKRGKRVRPKPDQGRKPAKNRKRENPGKSWQWFAEQKAEHKFDNLRALGSYWVGEDSISQWYEVVLKRD